MDMVLANAWTMFPSSTLSAKVAGGLDDLLLASGCELLIPQSRQASGPEKAWHFWTRHQCESERQYLSNVLVLDAVDSHLNKIMLGIRYLRIPRIFMIRQLGKPSSTPTHNMNKNGNKYKAEISNTKLQEEPASQKTLILS
ncbi:hypothetical protein F4860DRAFT_514953 [Xylaria cubensis]|nr:hypothetical protein F4860DRAFT_514953 [Xylaria cubensis]